MSPRLPVLLLCGLAPWLASCTRETADARPARPASDSARVESFALSAPSDAQRGSVASSLSVSRGDTPTISPDPDRAPVTRVRAESRLPAREQELPLAIIAAGHLDAFTPAQAAQLARLGESFLEESAAETDAAQGVQSARWNNAQLRNDTRFRALFGYHAYNRMLLARKQETRLAGGQ